MVLLCQTAFLTYLNFRTKNTHAVSSEKKYYGGVQLFYLYIEHQIRCGIFAL